MQVCSPYENLTASVEGIVYANEFCYRKSAHYIIFYERSADDPAAIKIYDLMIAELQKAKEELVRGAGQNF